MLLQLSGCFFANHRIKFLLVVGKYCKFIKTESRNFIEQIILKSQNIYAIIHLKSMIGGVLMLFRKIESLIEEHLKSDTKKILLIDGARQVGKTYIIRYVGEKLFENFIEINMVEDSLGDRLFAETKTVEDFYLQVSMLKGEKMKEKENTLIFIDEIQAYPHLLTLLKFLSQDNKFTYIGKRFTPRRYTFTNYIYPDGQH